MASGGSKDTKSSSDTKTVAVVDQNDMRAVVLSFPAMDKLAAAICAAHPKIFRHGSVTWKYFPGMYTYSIDLFVCLFVCLL